GHLITLVGYDDMEQCWICKNSWGKNWGEEGWVRISYDANLFINNCYGGTGILYLEGVYGNFIPDVPKIYIEKPKRYHIYIFGKEIPSIFGRVFVQIGIPRIVGFTYVKANVTNAEKVEFYVDGNLKEVDYEAPFSFKLNEKSGLHTVEAFAYKGNNISKSMIDVFVI
ncbi:MAG: C1 family peptidase, partial [Candidatus Thermoplasmatota archaeon]